MYLSIIIFETISIKSVFLQFYIREFWFYLVLYIFNVQNEENWILLDIGLDLTTTPPAKLLVTKSY